MNTEQELEKELEKKRALEQLLENRGWAAAVAVVQEQADELQREILFTPCTGLDSAMSQEYKKGQLEGRLCLSSLIQTEIEVCISTIGRLRRQQDERRTDGSNDDGSGGASVSP